MATAAPIEENKEDKYELELNRMREKIQSSFAEMADCLKAREDQLLLDLDNLIASYLSFRPELEKISEKKLGLETTKALLQKQLLASPSGSIHDDILFQLNTELKAIETLMKPKMFTFEFDSSRVLTELNKLSKFVEKGGSGIDYKSKEQPLVSVGKQGKENQHLNYPHGVTVDNKTGKIYIADLYSKCVKVFDSNGKYLFKFGDEKIERKMELPRGVAIYGNKILITQLDHRVLSYQLSGRFTSRMGRQGKGELEFDFPYSLTIDDSNGNIYICERSNNRVQILSKIFTFKAQFGKGRLIHPRDVKLSKEYIYVLDESNPCLHLFNYNYILQKSVITRGEGMDVINSYFFFIDKTNNILITDYSSNCINIYNVEIQLVHKISVSPCPMGITVDLMGRIIVVCRSATNCLQIY